MIRIRRIKKLTHEQNLCYDELFEKCQKLNECHKKFYLKKQQLFELTETNFSSRVILKILPERESNCSIIYERFKEVFELENEKDKNLSEFEGSVKNEIANDIFSDTEQFEIIFMLVNIRDVFKQEKMQVSNAFKHFDITNTILGYKKRKVSGLNSYVS